MGNLADTLRQWAADANRPFMLAEVIRACELAAAGGQYSVGFPPERWPDALTAQVLAEGLRVTVGVQAGHFSPKVVVSWREARNA